MSAVTRTATTPSTATAGSGSLRAAPFSFPHEAHQGFCTVCGSVWPCAGSARPALPRQTLRSRERWESP